MKSCSGRDPIAHCMRRSNTDMALQSMADGDEWTALEYVPQWHAWVERRTKAGAGFLHICNRFPGIVPGWSDAPSERLSAYKGSQWQLTLTSGSSTHSTASHDTQRTTVTANQLLQAYKLWYPAVASTWSSLHTKTISAYTHHSAPSRHSSGLGRYRAAHPEEAAHISVPTGAHRIHSTRAEDVLMQVYPRSRKMSRGETWDAPCRLAYFFTHEPNTTTGAPAHAQAMHAQAIGNESGTYNWAVVHVFTQHLHGPGRQHVQDETSDLYVYNLSSAVSVFPASNIKGHISMPHWCFFSGDKSQACHPKRGGGIQHVAREKTERYLYNNYTHYRDDDTPYV